MSNLLLHFPEGFTPNKSQSAILRAIEKALAENKKFIIVNAPTGAGKSFLPKTLANSINGPSEHYVKCIDNYSIFSDNGSQLIKDEDPFGVYALTITKSLQDQYKDTFDDTGIMKGQSNYQCAIDETCSVDVAPCTYLPTMKQKCWKEGICPYYNARNEMLKSKFSSLNYSMFFSLPDHLKKRKIIVCDEGSELEDQLVGQFTCLVDTIFLTKIGIKLNPFPKNESPSNVIGWLNTVIVDLVNMIEEYKEYLKSAKKSAEYNKKTLEYLRINNLYNSMVILVSTFNESQYVIEHIEKTIKFTPLKVDQLSKYIFDYADHVIILSATIIDPKNFCKNLGITDFKYLEAKSEFDPQKAPIFVMTKQKLKFDNMKEMLPKLARQVQGILDNHKDDKGIIHTHTQYITDYIRDNVHSDRLLCRETGVVNEELLDMHETSTEPTVLVSPSMTYGVDLKGDLAKFQIILKAPWLPTKEKRIEKLMKLDKDWYSNKMLCTLVQASGRGIRSKDDECVTYILDGSVYDAILRNQAKLPKHFLDRFQ